MWAFVFHGTIMANCVSCGIYITNKPDACHYVIEHSDTEVCCVENQEQLDKILLIWNELPKLKYVYHQPLGL